LFYIEKGLNYRVNLNLERRVMADITNIDDAIELYKKKFNESPPLFDYRDDDDINMLDMVLKAVESNEKIPEINIDEGLMPFK